MTIAFVQFSGTSTGTAPTPQTLGLGSNGLGAGDQLVVMLRIGSGALTPSITWSSGTGTFTECTNSPITDAVNTDQLRWYLCTNGGQSGTQISVAFSSGCSVRWCYHEYSVAAGKILIQDQEASKQVTIQVPAGTGHSFSGGTVTTTVANELVLGFFKTEATETPSSPNPVTAGSGFTIREAAIQKLFTEDMIVSAIGSYTASWTTTANWNGSEGSGNIYAVTQSFYEGTAGGAVLSPASYVLSSRGQVVGTGVYKKEENRKWLSCGDLGLSSD